MSRRILLAVTADISLMFLAGLPERLMAAGWEVHIVSSPGPNLRRFATLEHVTVHEIPMVRNPSPASDVVAMTRWLRTLHSVRPDVTVVGTPKAGFLGGMAAFVLRVPRRVYVLHGLRYEGNSGTARRIVRFAERLSCASAHEIVAVSQSVLTGAVRDSVTLPRKIIVLGRGSANGVDPMRFSTTPEQRREAKVERWPHSPETPVIGFVGRMNPDKGIDLLAESVRLVRDSGVACRLLVVGDAEDGMAGSAEMRRLESLADVEFTGNVPDVAPFLRLMDVLCLPTKREGLPTVVLEAGASGIPTVATAATGIADSVVDGETGLVCPSRNPAELANLLGSLLRDDERRARMGEAARTHVVTHFATADVQPRLLALLEGRVTEDASPARTPKWVTVFSGSRYVRSSGGAVAASAANDAADRWMRGLDSLPGMRLAARVSGIVPGVVDPVVGTQPEGTGAASHPVSGEVLPLPYYVGGRQLLRALPRVVRAVDRAVATSSVVVLKLPEVLSYPAALSSVLRRRPFAVDLAGDIEEVLRSGVGGRIGRRTASLNRELVRWIVRRAGAVRYVTTSTLQAKYPARPGIPTVAYSAVDLTEDWYAEAPYARKSDEPTILALGTQDALYKGHDDLIRALPAVQAEFPTASLVLVGDGRYQPHLRELATSLGVEDSVRFLGHVVDQDRVRALLDSAWVFAHPSRTEGLPRALIEAMARALPCVATPVGGIPELLAPEVLTPPARPDLLAASIGRLLGDESLRLREGRRNRAQSLRFHPDEMAAARTAWREAVEGLRRPTRDGPGSRGYTP